MSMFFISAKDDIKRRDRFSSNMDQSDMKENYVKSVEVIKELKKQNNSLQDAVKRLKARSRWPDHVQAAVCNKEIVQQKKKLETQVEELSNQCSAYEHQIDMLKSTQSNQCSVYERQIDSLKAPQARPVPKHDNDDSAAKSQLQKSFSEWKLQEKAYKQQLDELTSRLGETEERLAQVLRLRTMDSAELIRLARASKISAAQLTTQQDDNNKLKTALEQANTKIDKMSGEVREERDRVRQLSEEVTQTQLLRQSLQESAQELLELREENNVLRQSLQSVASDPGEGQEVSSEVMDEVMTLRSQLEEQREHASSEHKQLNQRLEQEKTLRALERKQLEERVALEVAERERVMATLQARQELDVRKQELQVKRRDSATQQQVPQTVTHDQGVQTLQELDFKPPEVSCAVSGEESDRILAQMYSELESHRELVRTQQHLTQLCKQEMEGLQQQLRDERAHYAEELSHKMSRLQELQSMVGVPRCPVPAPRMSVRAPSQPEREEDAQELEGFEVKIETMTATQDSPLIADSSEHRLFFEFLLLPSQNPKSLETPGNFAPPSTAGESVSIGHTHSWSISDMEESLRRDSAHVQFTVVGEPQSSNNEECRDFGTASFPLSEVLHSDDAQVTHDLEVVSDDGEVIGHLRVTCRKLTKN